jgi:hypothetical protein
MLGVGEIHDMPRDAVFPLGDWQEREHRELDEKSRDPLDGSGWPDMVFGDHVLAVDEIRAKLFDPAHDGVRGVTHATSEQLLDVYFTDRRAHDHGILSMIVRRSQFSKA